jgi:hypothetical protein
LDAGLPAVTLCELGAAGWLELVSCAARHCAIIAGSVNAKSAAIFFSFIAESPPSSGLPQAHRFNYPDALKPE